jgi:RHS repeat-associated protein
MNTWSRPNGLTSQFDWYPASAGANALGLKQIHHSQGGATVSKFGYRYDLAGRIQNWSRQLDPAVANQKDWSLAYSRSGELTGVVEKNASNIDTRRSSWSYDLAGNWYATGDATATSHRSHDAMNRLSQIGGAGKTVVEGTLNEPATVTVSGQPAQVSSQPGTSDYKFQKEIPVTQGTNNFQITATDALGNARSQNYSVQVGPAQKTYEYDSNGNLLREKDTVGAVIRSFEWDAADRLKAIVSGSQRIQWTYNSQGQKILETTNGTASKRYLWDGSSLLLERTPTGNITKRFYADGEQRVGSTDAGNYYYTRDHLGSVREVVNQAGIIQTRYDYDAYGKRSVLSQNPAYLNGCTFGYTGHLTLSSLTPSQSELVLTHYRAYDPQLGRWLSADPIGEKGGMNLYGYVRGDPVNSWDPFGLDADCDLNPHYLNDKGEDELTSYSGRLLYSKYQKGIVPVDGLYQVIGHGSPDTVYDDRIANERKLLNVIQLLNLIEKINPDKWKKSDKIKLHSCSTGYGDSSIAQYLADLSGKSVIAPTDLLSTTGAVLNGGKWKEFSPRKIGENGRPSWLVRPNQK